MVEETLCGSSPWKRSQRSFASRAWRGWNEGWRGMNGTEKRWWRRTPGERSGLTTRGWAKGVARGWARVGAMAEYWFSGFHRLLLFVSLVLYLHVSTIYSHGERISSLFRCCRFLAGRARSIFAKWIISFKDECPANDYYLSYLTIFVISLERHIVLIFAELLIILKKD